MDSSFFDTKRPWSRYKDFLLQSYLDPYLAKVAQLKKPILLVDCFAGRGMFGDGEVGSPLIIAQAISRWRGRGHPILGQFIEADAENYQSLLQSMAPFNEYCTARHGSFEQCLSSIEKNARDNTVFLYVDPYSVKGLNFAKLKSVYDHIRKSSSSVEVLLNFNVAIFMRWALAALKRQHKMPDVELETFADDVEESVEQKTLTEIAGGDYWIGIAENDQTQFVDKLKAFMDEYSKRLLDSFRFVCRFEVKEKYHHQVPKYVMVYATRHQDGVFLMNDSMCKARRIFVSSEMPKDVLFDMTPEEEIVEPAQLAEAIESVLGNCKSPMTRPQIRLKLFGHGLFARLTNSEINNQIGEMLKSKKTHSSTGKLRINDTVTLSLKPFV